MTDRNGKTTTYVYDAINRVTEIHRPNGISTYNTYNARDQIVSLKNTCDECGWVVSQYDYTYDDNGYIAAEKAVESLYDYAWDDKHNGRHEDGRHDDKMPHGTKHNGKHDKDSEYRFQLVETDREFTYDENGRLLSSKEQEENSGLTTYDYTYDKVGNRLSYVKRTQTTKHPNKTDVAESAFYQYNDSNQLVSAKLFDGKKNTTVDYTYDENGNLISEIGEYGTDKVETYYDYTVENRLQAVYDADRLLMAAAYDGDGNRVFQLNYNLHTDEDWKDNSGNGNGNNKDNTGSGNNGNGNSSSGNNGNNGNSGNGNGNSGNNGNIGNSGNGKGEGNTGNTGNGNSGNGNGNGNSGNNGNGNNKENSKSEGTDDAGYGNATNAEEHNSQNQSGILFPVAEEISRTETDLIAMIKTTGKEKDYELIEYILNVNTQYTQVLMELNENGAMDAAYTYGVSRLTEDRFTGESNFYLYDPAGNVAGITDQNGYLWQSYRYDAFGNATFGSPQYDNEYTFNAESYNPNIQSQYLRARYYDMVKGNFLTEDSYLGDIRNPLTLNRYSYCVGNPLFYDDPSGHEEIYVSGSDKTGKAFPYMFIETALHDIDVRKEKGYKSENMTWMVFTVGYSDEDKQNFRQTANNIGVGYVEIESLDEFINYINYKDKEGENNVAKREADKIAYMSFFSHGLTPKYSFSEETQLSFAYHVAGIETKDFEFNQSDIRLLNEKAFSHTQTHFWACNTGTDDNSGSSFAQSWSNLTQGVSVALRNGRSEYSMINMTGTDSLGMVGMKIPKFTFSFQDVQNKLVEESNTMFGTSFETSEEWEEKKRRRADRKELGAGNKEKGYSDKGSLSYPLLTSVMGDINVYMSLDIKDIEERGLTVFYPE